MGLLDIEDIQIITPEVATEFLSMQAEILTLRAEIAKLTKAMATTSRNTVDDAPDHLSGWQFRGPRQHGDYVSRSSISGASIKADECLFYRYSARPTDYATERTVSPGQRYIPRVVEAGGQPAEGQVYYQTTYTVDETPDAIKRKHTGYRDYLSLQSSASMVADEETIVFERDGALYFQTPRSNGALTSNGKGVK
jgi:hypothetical protein